MKFFNHLFVQMSAVLIGMTLTVLLNSGNCWAYGNAYGDVVNSYSTPTNNSSYLNEIHASLSNGYFKSYKVGNEARSQVDIAGSYLRLFRPQLQLGGGAHIHSETENNYFEFWGQANYNFDNVINQAFYGLVGLGIFNVRNDLNRNENKFGFYLGAGKRFPLWGNVSYSPEVRLVKKGDSDMNLEVYFINLSVFWN